MNPDGTMGMGERLLYCFTCEGYRMHDVARETTGRIVAECLICETEKTTAAPPDDPARGPKRVTGISAGARGRYSVHDWKRGFDGLWRPDCHPQGRKHAAKDVVQAVPSELHPFCRRGCRRSKTVTEQRPDGEGGAP